MQIEKKLDELVLHLMDVANEALERDGFILHFGAAITSDGEIEGRGYYAGERFPDGIDYVAELTQALRNEVERGRAIAVGQVSDVLTPPQLNCVFRDSVMLTIEAEGIARQLFFPYYIRIGIWSWLTGRPPARGWEPHFEEHQIFDTEPRVFRP